MENFERYAISTRLISSDGESYYEARVKEFPHLTEYADTAEEARELVIDAIETTAAILKEKGRPMPAPYEIEDSYSGRITLRIPKHLHRSLAENAAAEEVSLNQLLNCILSSAVASTPWRDCDVAVWHRSTTPSDSAKEVKVKRHLQVVTGGNGEKWRTLNATAS